jgi:3-(3-hydroxy-phenyl)propionate hydroxylase
MREKLAEYDRADVFLSTQATSFTQDSECVFLTVRDLSSDDTRVLQARYLVGCDGANSFVRKRLGIALEDLAFDEWWMVVDALTSEPTKRPNKCFQYCRPSRPGTYLPGPSALRRWEIKLLPGENPDAALEPENVLRLLSAFTDISDLTVWRSAVYRFHALLARQWRSDRIFIMGDAVHQTPPFLGQGLCAGIRDAANLAWKLAMGMRGTAGAELLDSYEAERKPHVRCVVELAKEFGKIIGELDPVAAKAREERLRAELKSGRAQTIRQKFIPPLKEGFIARDAKMAGCLFVQPHVRLYDRRVVRLDDVLEPEFVIMAATHDVIGSLSTASLEVLQRIGVQRVIVSDRPTPAQNGVAAFTETEQLFANWLQDNEIEAAVVRPDRYVFAGAHTAEELNALVFRLGRLFSGEPSSTIAAKKACQSGL